jgi:hypothetical protein
MKKKILKIIKNKLGVEPSILYITTPLNYKVKKSFEKMDRVWVESGINDDGGYEIYREVLEYDPSNIYFYIGSDQLTIYFNMKSKNAVDFLSKSLYNKLINEN